MGIPDQVLKKKSVYLLVDHTLVFEVPSNSTVTIGRLDTNDVVLDDYKVSREHALLKSTNDDFVLVDMASTHGTFVDEERIDRRAVGLGQVFKIVTHELVLLDELPKDDHGSPTLQLTRVRRLDRRLKFFGGLNEFALITLVQFLHQEKQSGLLILEQGQEGGPRIYFLDGDIIHVMDGENLADLMTRKTHDQSLFFYFHHETEFPSRTVMTSTPNYLMELCRQHDVDTHQKYSETTDIDINAGNSPVILGNTHKLSLFPLPPRPQ